MSLVVQTNVASLFAQSQISRTQQALSKTFSSLASGFRINGAADDAAGLGISKSINAQVRSLGVAQRNANDAISMIQTADGGAEQIHELLTRMRELAVQASNGNLVTNDLTNLNTEFTASRSEIDRIAASTTFNGSNLLSGAAASTNFQIGTGTATTDRIAVTFGGAGATQLAVNASTVDSFANAQSSITSIDAAIQSLSTVRVGFGASLNRLTGVIDTLKTQETNMSGSLSRMRDIDVARASAELSKNQVLAQAGVSVLAQANVTPQLALRLLS